MNISTGTYELSLVAYLYRNPTQMALHGHRVREINGFDYGPARELFETLWLIYQKYRKMPTISELSHVLTSQIAVRKNWPMVFREQVVGDAHRLQDMEITDLTGEFVSHWVVQRRSASISQQLISDPPETIIKNLPTYIQSFQELQILGARDFNRGIFPFSEEVLKDPSSFIEDVYGGEPVKLGLTELDLRLRGGMRPGELGIVVAATGVGKALTVSTPVLTPKGWTPMGMIREGDLVIGSDGTTTRVIGVYPQGELPTYRVNLTDGAYVDCCENHLWSVRTDQDSEWRTCSTRELMDLLSRGREIVLPTLRAPAALPPQPVDEDPYTVGLRVGDTTLSGHTRPHLPHKYTHNSEKVRVDLLRGLMDAQGEVLLPGRMRYSAWDRSLVYDVVDLVRSLGGNASRPYSGSKRQWCITVDLPDWLFRAVRSSGGRVPAPPKKRELVRSILSIEPRGLEPCQCIRVEAEDSLFCVKDYVLTHNSLLLVNIALSVMRQGKRVIYYALDNIKGEMLERIFAAATGTSIAATKGNGWGDDIRLRVGGANHLFYLIDFPPKALDTADLAKNIKMTRAEMFAIDARNGVPEDKAGHIDMVIVDYGDQIKPLSKSNEYRLQLKDVFEDLTNLAQTEAVPVLTASQGNRKSLSEEVVTLENLAEAFNKSWPASLVMTLCQTMTERHMGQMRLAVVKARRTENHYIVPCLVNYGNLRITDNPDAPVTRIEGNTERPQFGGGKKKKNSFDDYAAATGGASSNVNPKAKNTADPLRSSR